MGVGPSGFRVPTGSAAQNRAAAKTSKRVQRLFDASTEP